MSAQKIVLTSGAFYTDNETHTWSVPFEHENLLQAMEDFREALAAATDAQEKSFKFMGNILPVKRFRHGWRMQPMNEWFNTYKMKDNTNVTVNTRPTSDASA